MKKILRLAFLILFFSLSLSFFAQAKEHTVAKGDTLYSISRSYNLTVEELCSLNNIKQSEVLKIGQVLLVSKAIKIPQETETYVVQAGDTMYSIARRLSVSVETLNILNQLSNASLIKVGQVLTVPSTTSVQPDISQSASDLSLIDPRSYDTKKPVNKSLLWPVTALDIHYLSGKISGVSIMTNEKEAVKAVQEGVVMYTGPYRGFGQVVFVQATSKHIYVYTGLESIIVQNGQSIRKGDRLGIVGIDALSGKSALTFMVFLNGNAIDPAKAPR